MTELEDIRESDSVSLLALDEMQQAAVNRVALALDEAGQPNVATATLLAEILRTFLGTQTSIRLLISKRDKKPLLGSDAASLAREQVEKVFLVSYLRREWEVGVPEYFKDDWCRRYRYFLVQRADRQGLARFASFFEDFGPKEFEKRRDDLGISEDLRRRIEFEIENPGAKLPLDLSVRLPRTPTPKRILDGAPEPERRGLARWYEEYRSACGYTHAGADKLQMTGMTGRKLHYSDEEIGRYFDKQYLELLVLCYTACGYAAAELLQEVPGSLEASAKVTLFWNELIRASLDARVFWALRVRRLLPGLVG